LKSVNYIILSQKKWNKELINNLTNQFPECNIRLISTKEEFNLDILNQIKPDKIFIPHWSYIIPEEIYSTYECIVFHMTDLPYGRGGSPLQNLIVRKHKETQISALKVDKGIDTGDIYLKSELSLLGTAEEIFIRANKQIEKMIIQIIQEKLMPYPQEGNPVLFVRRKPEDSNIENLQNIDDIFDYIRMLDAEGYPKAYLEFNNFKLEFSRASLKSDKSIIADVRIIQK